MFLKKSLLLTSSIILLSLNFMDCESNPKPNRSDENGLDYRWPEKTPVGTLRSLRRDTASRDTVRREGLRREGVRREGTRR